MPGATLRANSPNTRCWYSISLTKRAAWKIRSPFQESGPAPAPSRSCQAVWRVETVVAVSTLPGGQASRAGGVVDQHVLDVGDQPVVLGVEHLVDRTQCDVLVAAAV